jgi:hypothetical protein
MVVLVLHQVLLVPLFQEVVEVVAVVELEPLEQVELEVVVMEGKTPRALLVLLTQAVVEVEVVIQVQVEKRAATAALALSLSKYLTT